MSSLAISNFFESLPKTETHLHIEGALPWTLLEKKYPDRFSSTPYFREAGFRYDTFEQFEAILIDHAMAWFESLESYHEAARTIFNTQIEQNIKYVETSFHAGMIEFLKLPGEEILEAILDAVPAGIEVRVFLGISRNSYTQYLGPRLEEAIKWDNLSGIDLHGLESLPLESWTIPFWKKAREAGKIIKAHAGEFGPASNVREAVNELNVRRIQHGTRSIEDSDVVKLLCDKGVTLDMCPISNYKLRVIDKWSDHPIQKFMNNGVRCTVSTDDPMSFNNSLIDEYIALHENLSLSVTEMTELVSNGFQVADLDKDKKDKYLDEIVKLAEGFVSLDE